MVSYPISNHSECENIALLGGDSFFKIKRGGIQQLRCQVLEVIEAVESAGCDVESKGEPIVSQTRMAAIDENVPLGDIFSDERRIVGCVY